MRTKTYTKTVYTLDEVKAVAIQTNWNIKVDEFWYEYALDDAATVFGIVGYDLDREQPFYFSGFSSQGDGACINQARWTYAKGSIEKIKDYAPQDTELHQLAKRLQKEAANSFYTASASIRHSGHYYHENSMYYSIDYEKGTFDESEFKQITSELCHWLYRQLEKEYDYLTSEKAILETLEAKEYEFDENGVIV